MSAFNNGILFWEYDQPLQTSVSSWSFPSNRYLLSIQNRVITIVIPHE